MQVYGLLILFLLTLINEHIVTTVLSEELIPADDDKNYIECETTECKNSASEIRNSLDLTIDPCDNFYQFACGGWIKNHPTDESHQIVSEFQMISEATTGQIKEIFEGESKPEDTAALQKARDLYKLCMDVDELESIGTNALKEYVEDNGGWPMIMSTEEWEAKNLTWQQISDILEGNRFRNGLYKIIVIIDDKDSTKHVIAIGEPLDFIQRETLIEFEKDSDKKDTYMSYILKVAQIFIDGTEEYSENENLARDVLDLVDFEIKLAKLTTTRETKRKIEEMYNERTIEQFQQEYDAQNPVEGQIDWFNVIRKIFAQEEISIEESEKIIVRAYKYLTNIVPLLEQTSSRTIVNYIQWTFIRDLLPYANNQLETIFSEMRQRYRSQQSSNERWQICSQRKNLVTALSYEYVKKYIQNETKEDVYEMFVNIENVVHDQISASTWMDSVTKTASLDKLSSMEIQIAGPNWYSNDAVDHYYEDLTITPQYFESAVNFLEFETSKQLRQLRKPVDRNRWHYQPTEVESYYKVPGNIIFITAATLQGAIYNKVLPVLLNYATLGAIIGHEINHGFDDYGRKYDKYGNSIEWWTQESTDNYKQLTQCFIDQYNSYTVPGVENVTYVNGRVSLGENIGDSAGIVGAYSAYENRKRELKVDKIQLPGLEEYTDDQLFFITYAHMLCDNITPDMLQEYLLYEHPRWETRVRGTLSNFQKFSEVFNCPKGTEMNPDKRCMLWQ